MGFAAAQVFPRLLGAGPCQQMLYFGRNWTKLLTAQVGLALDGY
jgi:hypothetical protein